MTAMYDKTIAVCCIYPHTGLLDHFLCNIFGNSVSQPNLTSHHLTPPNRTASTCQAAGLTARKLREQTNARIAVDAETKSADSAPKSTGGGSWEEAVAASGASLNLASGSSSGEATATSPTAGGVNDAAVATEAGAEGATAAPKPVRVPL